MESGLEGLAWIELFEVDAAVKINIIQLNQVGVVVMRKWHFLVSSMSSIHPSVLIRVVVKAVLNKVPVMWEEVARAV